MRFRFGLLALAAVASASSLTPGVLPLIVRNPYLSTWMEGARDEPWERWPMFWTGASVSAELAFFGLLVSRALP